MSGFSLLIEMHGSTGESPVLKVYRMLSNLMVAGTTLSAPYASAKCSCTAATLIRNLQKAVQVLFQH